MRWFVVNTFDLTVYFYSLWTKQSGVGIAAEKWVRQGIYSESCLSAVVLPCPPMQSWSTVTHFLSFLPDLAPLSAVSATLTTVPSYLGHLCNQLVNSNSLLLVRDQSWRLIHYNHSLKRSQLPLPIICPRMWAHWQGNKQWSHSWRK